MKPSTPSLQAASNVQPAANAPEKRAGLHARLLQINADLAALTPDAFNMPQSGHLKSDALSPLQARIKKNELVLPDTEVLRRLLLEKARIAEQLDTLPHSMRESGPTSAQNGFAVKTKTPTLR